MKDFADRIIDGIVYGDDKDKIPPNQKWGEEVEEDGENVRIAHARQAEINRALDADPDDYRDNEENR